MRFFCLILSLCSLLFGAFICPACAQDGIVAIVNKEVITSKELRDFENFLRLQMSREYDGRELEDKVNSMRPELLDKLIDDRLILQEAHRAGVQVNEEKVKARVRDIVKRYGSEFEFKEELRQQGLVPGDIERKIREQFMTYALIQDRVNSRVEVKPEEVTAYYRQHSDEYNRDEERVFETVASASDEVVRTARHDLVRGQSLDVVKQRYGVQTDEMIAIRGKGLKPQLEKDLFALPENGVSDVILSGDTFYLFRVKQILPARTRTLQEAQDEIYAQLYDQKTVEAMQSWLNGLKAKAYIKKLK